MALAKSTQKEMSGEASKKGGCLDGLLKEGWLLAGKVLRFQLTQKSVNFSRTPEQRCPLELSMMTKMISICTIQNGSHLSNQHLKCG